MAKLGEVCKVSPSTKNIERQGAWLLNLDMVEQQTGRVVEYNFVGEDDLNGSIIQFDTENVLYSKLRPNLNKVVLPEKDGFSTSELLPLRPDASVLNRDYLAVFLRSDSFVTWAVSKTAGAKMPRLGTKDLMNAEIPVPNIERQKEIAEKFKKLEQLISLRKQQLTKLDELVKARFVEMFGDEQAFNKEPLSQNVEEMFIGPFGSSLKNESFVSKENGYCMVYEQKHAIRKTMDVETRYIDKPKYEELKRFSIHGGDIIVSCRGTIGETYIVPLNAPLGIMHPSIMKIRVKESIYNRVFFDFLLQEKLKKHEAQANGSGVKMAVTASALGKEEFIVPSIPFQNQFAAFVERVDQQKQTVQQSLEKLELMKKVLMQEYFG